MNAGMHTRTALQAIPRKVKIATALKIKSLPIHARVEALAFIKSDGSSYALVRQDANRPKAGLQ
jgi:hypothetical protein